VTATAVLQIILESDQETLGTSHCFISEVCMTKFEISHIIEKYFYQEL
jgi:hypothetical protein